MEQTRVGLRYIQEVSQGTVSFAETTLDAAQQLGCNATRLREVLLGFRSQREALESDTPLSLEADEAVVATKD